MGWGDSNDPAPPRSDRGMPANCTVQPCPCVPIQAMRVTALEFVNDHGLLTNYQKDFKSGGQKYSKPEWTSSHAYPVSYSMDQYIEVYLTVEVKPANACEEVGTLTGKLNGEVLFEAKNWTFRPGLNKIFMVANTALPHKVQASNFVVLWEVTGTSARLADTTSNRMYVTYDTPYNDTKDTTYVASDAPHIKIEEKRLDNEVTEKRLQWICALTNGDTNGHDSMEKIHKARGDFDLNAPTPRPHWEVAAGGIRCQCVDLAKFWMLTAEMLGLRTGEVMYLYPKLLKGTKESSNPRDMETRAVKTSVPPHGEYQAHGKTEFLVFVDTNGGENRYEACYKFTHPDKAGKMLTRYYAGGSGVFDTKEAVMKAVCKETKWIYHTTSRREPVRVCENPGPNPTEKWKE